MSEGRDPTAGLTEDDPREQKAKHHIEQVSWDLVLRSTLVTACMSVVSTCRLAADCKQHLQ